MLYRLLKTNLLACVIAWLPLQVWSDIRLEYLDHVRSYSTCAAALMPWAKKDWHTDQNEMLFLNGETTLS